jgi:hypothetical protein
MKSAAQNDGFKISKVLRFGHNFFKNRSTNLGPGNSDPAGYFVKTKNPRMSNDVLVREVRTRAKKCR